MTVFCERLLKLIEESGKTKKEINGALGLGANTIKNWEKSGFIPSRSKLLAISGYFGVSVEYLLGETDDRGTKKPSALTEEQLAIVMKVTSLSPKNQEEAMRYLDFLISRQESG